MMRIGVCFTANIFVGGTVIVQHLPVMRNGGHLYSKSMNVKVRIDLCIHCTGRKKTTQKRKLYVKNQKKLLTLVIIGDKIICASVKNVYFGEVSKWS